MKLVLIKEMRYNCLAVYDVCNYKHDIHVCNYKHDIHVSVHHDTIYESDQQDVTV
jgi:hypothetical protein